LNFNVLSITAKNTYPFESVLKQERPLLIAGPCSAETIDQVMETAKGLASLGKVDIFRCGIWKPRTRPNEFEGVGDKGLEWLKQAREETGLPVMVEVARPCHVEKCLEAGIDMMWLGSRTIVNPFSVEEIAVALEGSGSIIFLKNPVNPDIKLWLGAFERLEQHGVHKLAAIHRGFSVPNPGAYRNAPLWNLYSEFMRQRPGTPIIGDPSHICGGRELLARVSRQALDLGYQGLMIESHIRPEKALTDRQQQITPSELGKLLDTLDLTQRVAQVSPLEALRAEIDRLDDDLLAALAGRMAVSEKIGRLKKELGLNVEDAERWEAVLKDRLLKADLSGLDRGFLKDILEEIHKQSIKKQ
jgi:3-deoxy-7-phosphoheptulonate synthase